MANLTVGDVFSQVESLLDAYGSGKDTKGTLDSSLASSLSSAMSAIDSELHDKDKSEKLKLGAKFDAQDLKEIDTLAELKDFVGTAIASLNELGTSVSGFSGALTSLQSFKGGLDAALAPPATSTAASTSSTATALITSSVADTTTSAAATTSSTSAAVEVTSSTILVQPTNLFADPVEVTVYSTASATATADTSSATASATVTAETATASATAAVDDPEADESLAVAEHLKKFKADKGKDLDDETNAVIQAAIDEADEKGKNGKSKGITAALGNVDDLAAFVNGAVNFLNSLADQVLNPAGKAPPGLNKLKEHLDKRNQSAPDAPPAGGTDPAAGTTTSGTGSTSTSGTSTTSSTGGNVNINIGGTGSVTVTSGSTGGTTSTGGSTSGAYTGGYGSMSGVPLAGTVQTEADFGIIQINGVTTYLGSVQAPYMTSQQAAEYVAGAINNNSQNTVQASVDQNGLLTLASKDGSSAITIDRVGVSTTGNTDQLVNLGLQAGTYGTSVTTAVSSPYFADTFDQVFQAVSSGSMTAPTMNNTSFMTASTSTALTSAKTASATAVATASATAAAELAAYTASRTAVASNPIAGYTNINEPITASSLTDFGKMTINGREYNLGSVQTISQTQESAAQYLASVFNVQGTGQLSAQAFGGQLILTSQTAGDMLRIDGISPTLDLMDPNNRFGFTGFSVGMYGAGSLIGGNVIY